MRNKSFTQFLVHVHLIIWLNSDILVQYIYSQTTDQNAPTNFDLSQKL